MFLLCSAGTGWTCFRLQVNIQNQLYFSLQSPWTSDYKRYFLMGDERYTKDKVKLHKPHLKISWSFPPKLLVKLYSSAVATIILHNNQSHYSVAYLFIVQDCCTVVALFFPHLTLYLKNKIIREAQY